MPRNRVAVLHAQAVAAITYSCPVDVSFS